MPSEGAPDSSRARWVGVVDENQVAAASVSALPVVAVGGADYARARVLVRDGALVRGFVDVALTDGTIDPAELAAQTEALPAAATRPALDRRPSVTVVICTRDRSSILSAALTSILAVDYPNFDVVVVDNASATSATSDLVSEHFADPRVTLVTEPFPGLAGARNTGIAHATGEFIAFTDDDVLVDAGWLDGLVAGFARSEDADCVVGLVPSGELRTRVQSYFDERVTWSHNLTPRVFSMDEKPADLPTFPFSVGQFGTGANFALRRSTLARIGGFDTAFGVGTRTGGGEDIDMFSRVLLAGGTLVVEPSALVWHRHRADIGALRTQAEGYGLGLGAWLTKLVLDSDTLPLVLARGVGGVRRLLSIGAGGSSAPRTEAVTTEDADWAALVKGLGALELRAALKGPARYARQRFDGRGIPLPAAAPLAPEPTVPLTIGRRQLSRWGAVAALAGIAGLLSAFPFPETVQAVLVALLVFVGPGAALRAWVRLPALTTAVAVPGIGFALAILVPSGMAIASAWHSHAFLVVLALVTTVAGALRWVPSDEARHRKAVAL
nr:glycosyltransferase [Conyzicola lurida]